MSDLLFVPEKHKKNLNSRLASCTFLRLSLYWPSGREGGGAATRKIYRVFLRTGEGQSPGEGRGGEKAKLLVHLFCKRYAEDDVRTPPHSA